MPEISYNAWREAKIHEQAMLESENTTARIVDEKIAQKCRQEIETQKRHRVVKVSWEEFIKRP
jgi:hypothetical protein